MSPTNEIDSGDEGQANHVIRLAQLWAGICGAWTRQELFSLCPLLRSALLQTP